MSRYPATQPPRLQSGSDIDSLSSSVGNYYHEALPWSPRFLSLQEGLRVVCLDHARGKVSDTDLPRTYHGPSFTPVKTTHGRFCCITGVAFQDEGRGPETFGYVVEKGDLSYVLQPEPTDANTSADGSMVNTLYEVCAKVNSKTQYLVRPRDLPSPEDCPKSYRELYERAVGSVYGKQTPVPLPTQSPLLLPPTANSISHAYEFCRPLDDSITKVSCRVARFADLGFGVKQIQEFVVIEFSLISGEWQEDDRHYSIPVSVDDQCYPFDVIHLACWAHGAANNVPAEPTSQSCKTVDIHVPSLDKNHSHLSSSNIKRPRSDERQAQRRTSPSTKNRKVLPKDLTPSPPPSAVATEAEASTYRFPCDLCPKNFASRKGLNAHMGAHDKNRPSFACDACERRFTRPSDMERHKATSHENKKYPCKRCGRSLSRADGLLNHQRTCQSKLQ
ncbi:hypothetical protein BG015_009401 [Linnemannia schmuckeri]|uniref:C2H2-type domain-containing protein n=1 Tax=Linnemannia schmuckeri TaxID=64567 RepID=A0A9P5V9T3_9FUNG|nr:hypothetical protein BG015_009401 [Linnemannia schmuckeri]